MRNLIKLIGIYLSGLPVFIIIFYFMTATPTGQLSLSWNLANGYLTLSYLIAFPILLMWLPNLRRGHFTMKSLATRSTELGSPSRNQATNPIAPPSNLQLLNQQHDDTTNFLLFLFERGILSTIALPVIIIVASYKGVKHWHKK
ncbi:hypothetical protein [Lactiplantibacillus mudanjiangensis]|uniref:Uncharacterized protein n=1 Tax=Lactiplantibacillus mudanjiangensis TaxID=1296538 RepID=A0A660DZ75_9LACO|nr:hypothetical protein [Lactiplantibacillus mudanjiangensis]VDG18943.1 hypothetical protein (plasmid) [Lactobacillus plantarum] [Lactiplantibacillus mudanjiangensis]VDG25280.1 hypothetical protein (plasmid) [Lactobacillus plantarum] [Lactiplantibacillus mudanjiangensis]VDG27467.1 hypothetical protein (plasmid) [Lactobacillus plantarum] [Lactiplantibacillus mudanjiangensis]VDG33044.1 hypothetical protein (plasmid) [Lactobacillus plantarum] [Lactiplantibacillus mudanjiangensis]